MRLRPPTAEAAATTLAAATGLWSGLGLAARAGRWRTLQRQFDQRPQRERLLMIAAAAALTLMAADALWLGPAIKTFGAARGQQLQAQTTLQGLQVEAERLSDDGSRLAQTRQADLADWRSRVRHGETALRQHEDRLVGPEQMIGLLEHLLARHGEVRVRALRSLGRSDLLAPTDRTNTDTTTAAPAAAGPASAAGASGVDRVESQPSLYRHGVELVIEGSYADLLAYLQAMEALPQHVLWGSMGLRVEQYPKSVLTLRVYTISRARHWLEI